jgi:archaellum component FlaC
MVEKQTIDTVFGTLDDDQLKALREGSKEISIHLTKIEIEREGIKDIVSSLKDELKIPKKIINRIAKTYHKQNFAEVSVEDTEFAALYTTIVSSN